MVFFMPMVFGLATLGFYNLATRVLSAPAALISSAIGQVFLHEATKERQVHGHARSTFSRTVRRLTAIGLPIFVCAYFLSEPIFALVFGEQWRAAGIYAAALTPLLFARFVVSTVSMMNIVFEKNHVGFYWQLILALLSLGLIWAAHQWQWSFERYLWTMSLTLSTHYLALLFIMSRYNKPESAL
jgi:O-antigen/teichoic acid export membrane protein